MHACAANELEGHVLHVLHTVLAVGVQLVAIYSCTAHALHVLHTALEFAVQAANRYSVCGLQDVHGRHTVSY